MPIKRLTPNRHIQLIKRILHNKVRIQLIHLPQHDIDIGRQRIGKQQELGPRQRLEAGEAEPVGFEDLEAGGRDAGDGESVGGRGGRDSRGDGAGDGVDAGMVVRLVWYVWRDGEHTRETYPLGRGSRSSTSSGARIGTRAGIPGRRLC